ncbi:MAG TPA: hypothetical protein VGM81_22865 [Burkholderiaceae bacterium]|jgi:hypothetical protein
MHLVIPHAGAPEGLDLPPLPHLAALLGPLRPAQKLGSDEYSLDTPLEQFLAQARGEAPAVAAWLAADQGLDASRPWALLTPLHMAVSTDQVTAYGPESLQLSDDESRNYFDSLGELWPASEGWESHHVSSDAWLVSHASLAGLSAASLDRVVQRSVEPWMPEPRRLRTLQNEVQMLLHRHPLNETRSLPLNSVWISGCGASTRPLPAEIRVDQRLREPLLAGDWASWLKGWQALDAELPALAPTRITLCGERFAQTYEAGAAPGLLPSLWRKLTPPRADTTAALNAL